MHMTLLIALALIIVQYVMVTSMSYMNMIQTAYDPSEVLVVGLSTLFIVLVVDIARTQLKLDTGE